MGEEATTDAELQAKEPVLGPEYFRARKIAQGVLANIDAADMQDLRNIAKTLSDEIESKIWNSIVNYLLSDTEYNLQQEIQRRIENAVSALLSGEQWALNRYVLDGRYTGSVDAAQLRKAIASYIPKELQNARIAELEKQVEGLRRDVDFYRNR